MIEELKPSDFTMLIVDDNPQNLMVLGSILQKEGFKIAAAKDGKAAVELAHKVNPDMILMDIMMPEMDGYQATKILKSEERYQNVPIIFLSAKTEAEDIVEGFSAGGADYITKPFKKLELLIRVRHHLALRRSRQIIEEQTETLRKIIATRDKLFSIIAHDLRNPLVNIKMLITGLQQSKINLSPEKSERMMMLFSKSVDETYSMLENLLEWARSQRGTINHNPAPFSVKMAITEVTNLFEEPLKRKGLELKITIAEDFNVYADKNLFTTTLRNLISNSVKFTPTGFIEVQASPGEMVATIKVIDTGLGISSENIGKLFKETEHFSTYGTSNEKGSGLGLNLCKDFAEKNGGTIGVESEEGKGSTFWFTVPHEE